MPDKELSREEFEKWARSMGDRWFPESTLCRSMVRGKDAVGYSYGSTQLAWLAAQYFYAAASGEALRCENLKETLGNILGKLNTADQQQAYGSEMDEAIREAIILAKSSGCSRLPAFNGGKVNENSS